ncbi:MAG: hypothetical protein WC681_12685 [Sterolibacterium sp.]|jgi:hypothetical protein
MSGITPLQMADNLNKVIDTYGAALCTLGEILEAVDEERLRGDYALAGVGYLLQVIGTATLERSSDLGKHLATVAYSDSSTTPA